MGVLAGLVLTEVALRVWTAVANPPMYVLDARLGWKHAAGVDRGFATETGRVVRFTTDARGLRATPHGDERTAGRRRVLFAGDSFTQGSQVPESELFTVRLERELGVECFNAGVGGYSTLQELRALPDQLAAYAPDLVVLVVYENDFQDNLMSYYSFLGPRPHVRVRGTEVEVVDAPDPRPFERFLMPAPFASWCYEHVAIYRALHKNVFWPSKGVELVNLEQAERSSFTDEQQRVAMQWLLQQCAAVVRAKACELLVAAIPTREDARAGVAPSHEWLAGCCTALGVRFVSLLPALRAGGVDAAYFPTDIHLTELGHECVAKALREPIDEALRRRD